MFGSMRKKNRQPVQPLTAATANPNAATAAAAVFGRRDSNTSLSSAAAAAALRNRPTTPINVSEVQTKRTQKRSTSVSSHGSHPEHRRDLHRTPSQGSMTERTFRSPSPSPNRPVSSHAQEDPPPPVPSIPDEIRSSDGKEHKKAASIHTMPFRVASQKQKDGGRGSWFGAATEGDLSNVRMSDAAMRSAKSPEQDRHGAVSPSSSINFSYPRGKQGGGPPSPVVDRTPSVTHSQRYVAPRHNDSAASSRPASIPSSESQALVYDPNSRRMVAKAELMAPDQYVRGASEKPVKKKKKSQASLRRNGSHSTQGSAGKVKEPSVQSEEPAPQSSARTQPQPEPPQEELLKPEPKALQEAPPAEAAARATSAPPSQPIAADFAPVEEADGPVTKDVRVSDGATVLPHAEPKEPTPVLGRQPPPVEEDETTDEEDENTETVPDPRLSASDALHTRPATQSQAHSPLDPENNTAVEASEAEPHTPSATPVLKQHDSVRSSREHSNSPVRNARFSLTTDQLLVKHEPPPRSLSPRKSAMKHSTSPSRGASPSDDGSDMSAVGGVVDRDDADVQRKRSVRVSFDDQSTKVIGEAAQDQQTDSPLVPSPQQSRRPWFSNIGRSKKKDLAPLDDDELMRPRPALPMFGSIREKKPREAEERPLVRPSEPSHSPASTIPTAPTPDDELQDAVGQSNDQNVGSVLQQDYSTRNEANTSKTREPLPPVVTSLEGSGYYSPSSTDSEDEVEAAEFHDQQARASEENDTGPTVTFSANLLSGEQADDDARTTETTTPLTPVTEETDPIESPGNVPTISIIEPSPSIKEPEEADREEDTASYFDVPGGFPVEDSDEFQTPKPASSRQATATQPGSSAAEDDAEADDQQDLPSSPVAKAPDVSTIQEEPESSSGSSIYSDAYEDMSEAEGDGFMSLDAVLTTPVSDKKSHKAFDKAANASPQRTEHQASSPASQSSPTSGPSGECVPGAETPDDWEKAKAYWKGLTMEKRRQLEQEALEEAGVQADQEDASQPTVKTKKRRSKRSSMTNTEVLHSEQNEQAETIRVYQVKPGSRLSHNIDAAAPSIHPQPPAPSQESNSGKLKKSLRGSQAAGAAPAAEPALRKTLRSGPVDDRAAGRRPQQGADLAVAAASGGMRKSMRQDSAGQKTGSQQRTRPVSLPQPPVSHDQPEKHRRQKSLEGGAAGAAMANAQPTLRRRGSDSSESSFKRARPQRQGLGFRKSMRASSPERPSTASGNNNRSSRFSIRSLSPVPSPSQQSPLGAGNRTSMRSTLRSGDTSDGNSTHRMRIPGFGKSPGNKKTDRRAARKQRFADSSDEEDDSTSRQATFRSRFADSSDEDELAPPPAAPASRGGLGSRSMRNGGATAGMVAARQRELDQQQLEPSPDLPDSDDDEDNRVAPPPQRTPSGRVVENQGGLQRKRSGRGELMETNAASTQAQGERSARKGGGFLSVLRRKKDREAGKISRPDIRESAAREGTKLERSSDELAALRRANSDAPPQLQQPSSPPRLQKARVDSWPLPDEDISKKRPSTANNAAPLPAMTGSPKTGGFLKRRSTSYQGVLGTGTVSGAGGTAAARPRQVDDGSAADGHSQADGSVMKKKKFGKLRKMFGLND